MTYIRSAYALAGIEELVEFFEYAPSERDPIGITLYSDFITARVNFDTEGPLDQPKRLFPVPVEGNGRRVIVESQALVGRFMFSSQ
jgi:hypothetical protein